MTMELLQELTADPRLWYQHTVDKYHRMIKSGMVEEGAPFELLDGQIVRKIRSAEGEDPMTVGDEHAYVVMKLNELGPKLLKLGCHLRPQQPITLPPNNEPEPDAAIVRGKVQDYRGRHPGAKDVICVIEVSEASLRRDRTTKQQIYAAAGIETYIIINLIDRGAEIYTRPSKAKGAYGDVRQITANDSFKLPTAGSKSLTVRPRDLFSR